MFWKFFFISSLCIFSLGVLCRLFNHFRKCIISYKSQSYNSCICLLCAISFFLQLWNIAFEIIELVLFLFDLLCDTILLSSVVEPCPWDNSHCPASFRSSLFAIFLLSSVVEHSLSDTRPCVFFFDLLCTISFCFPGLLNLACGMFSKSLCCLLLFHLIFLMSRECVSFILLFYLVFLMS